LSTDDVLLGLGLVLVLAVGAQLGSGTLASSDAGMSHSVGFANGARGHVTG
jgi:hypothetical protein